MLKFFAALSATLKHST